MKTMKPSSANRKLAISVGSYGSTLGEIEDRIMRIVRTIFIDSHGYVRGGVNASSVRPFTEADLASIEVRDLSSVNACCPYRYKKLLMNYEESDMATGDLLMALIHKHRVTRDAKTLALARAVAGAIRLLCKNSFETNVYGRGWLPKPYAGICDVSEMFETSVDQYCKITLALDLYRQELAAAREKKAISKILVAFADWWLERDYTQSYFGYCEWFSKSKCPHGVAFFLYLLALAKHITGQTKYRKELLKMLSHRHVIPAKLAATSVNCANLIMECMERLLHLAPRHRSFWLASMQSAMRFSKAHTKAEGYCTLNMRTGKKNIFMKITTGVRAACSAATMVGGGLAPARWEDWAQALLLKHNRKEMFYHIYPDGTPPPKLFAFAGNVLSGHHYAAWLHAYWKLRRATGGSASFKGKVPTCLSGCFPNAILRPTTRFTTLGSA